MAVSVAAPLAGPAAAGEPSSPSPSAAPAGSHLPKALEHAAPAGPTTPATPSASVRYGFGLNPTPGLPRGVSKAVTDRLRTTASYPASYDLSQWAPPVGDQNPVGSCGSWSTGYYYRYWLRNHDLGETVTFAPMYLYSQIVQGHDTGSTFPENFNILESQGIARQSDYLQGNYDYTTQPTPEQHAAAAPYKIGGYSLVFSGAGGGDYRSAVQATISAGEPVLFSIPVYQNFKDASYANPYIDVPTAGMTLLGWHGVFATAYDEWGVWIENSWGTSHGLSGWVELSWAFINQYPTEAWTMTDEPWSVDLTAAATNVTVGTPVALTAHANRDVNPTPHYIVILRNDGSVTRSCGTGTTCSTSVTSSVAASWTYHAVIGTSTGASPQATSPPVTVTWATVPSAPTGVTVVAGTLRATVSWTAPASNGGSAITGYAVTSAPGGKTCSPAPATGTTCIVTDLANGTPYTFTVKATNLAGTGPASAASVPLTLAPTVVTCTPGTPGGIVAAVSGSTVACVVTPGSGAGFTGWTASGFTPATSGSAAQSFTAGSPGAGSIVAAYTDDLGSLGVTFGYSISAAVTVPGAPTGVTATAGNAQALVSWSAPSSDGGGPITSYTVTSAPDGRTCATSGALSCTVSALASGTPYTFTVTATNAVGTGPASAASAPVTPKAPAVPPTASITGLPTWLSTNSIGLHWGATPSTAGATSYDVRYLRAAWNGSFGSYVTWRTATTATSATFPGSPGSTYCFSVRARDPLGLVSAWTAATCTAIPLDDRSLTRYGRWTAGTGTAYYRSTYLRSSSSGAKLTRTGVVAKRIAIVATTCPTCGSVRVYWGSTLLRTISLRSATTVNKKLITVTTFTSARRGTLMIKVYSSGKKVLIDGVAIRRN